MKGGVENLTLLRNTEDKRSSWKLSNLFKKICEWIAEHGERGMVKIQRLLSRDVLESYGRSIPEKTRRIKNKCLIPKHFLLTDPKEKILITKNTCIIGYANEHQFFHTHEL